MKIGELFIELFFKSDQTKLKDFIKDLGELNMSSILSAGALAAVYEGIKNIMAAGDQAALAINNFSAQTGRSSQEFQKWSKVAEQAGLDAGLVNTSVQTLMDSVQRMKLTGEGANAWNMLGIDPRNKDEFTLMLEIAKKIQGLDTAKKRFLIGNLGLSKEDVQLFDYIAQHETEIAKQLTSSEESLAKMKEWHKDINKLSSDWRTFLTDIAAILEPIVGFIVRAADGLVAMLKFAEPLLKVMVAIAGAFGVIIGLINPATRLATIIGLILAGVGTLRNIFDPASSAAPSGSNVTNGDYRNQTSNVKFYVTGNDPKQIAKEVDARMQKHLSDAEYQNSLENY